MKNVIGHPILCIGISFSLGILMSPLIPFSSGYLYLGTLFLLVLVGMASKSSNITTVFLLCIFMILGVVYTQSYQILHKKHVWHVAKFYRQRPAVVRGIVSSDVEKRDFFQGKKISFVLDVKMLKTKWGWRNKQGKVLVNIFNDADIVYGDHLALEGKLHRPYNFSSDEGFSYVEYLKHRRLHLILSVKKTNYIEVLERNKGSRFRAFAFKVRNRLKNTLSKHLTKNEAGIMRAILLGDRSHIPKHIRELFVQTGTAHILAISGLHIGMVAVLFCVFLKMLPLPREIQLVMMILLLIGYAFLTGGRPSVIRATIMAVVFSLSFILEREGDILNTVGLAGILILLINPLNLFDVGFQLSFVCVLAIIVLTPRIMALCQIKGRSPAGTNLPLQRIRQFFIRYFSLSLAVWLGAAGFVAYYFHIITPVTLLANFFVIPLISVLVTLGFGLLMAGTVMPVLACFFSVSLKLVLNVLAGLIFLFTQLPYAYFYVRDVNVWQIGIYYSVLWVLFSMPWRRYLIKYRQVFPLRPLYGKD